MKHFCTYCDQGYAARLLCLHESLLAQGEPFVLSVLCLDGEVAAVVRSLRTATLVATQLDELLAADPAYAAVRTQRSAVEFIFTATPVWVRFCLERHPEADHMTYLDADLWFFGPASSVLAAQGDAAVGIVPHRFPSHLKERERYGVYNVAWVSFRRNSDGLACLAWWREQCLAWCFDRVEEGRFADQGYLNEFSRLFKGVVSLDHPGINAAPWNMAGVSVSQAETKIEVAGQPLFFYHFQGLREVAPGWFEPGLLQYHTPMTAPLRDFIYRPYLNRLLHWQRRLQLEHGWTPKFRYQRLNAGASLRHRWERVKSRWVLPYLGRLRGRLIKAKEDTT